MYISVAMEDRQAWEKAEGKVAAMSFFFMELQIQWPIIKCRLNIVLEFLKIVGELVKSEANVSDGV